MMKHIDFSQRWFLGVEVTEERISTVYGTHHAVLRGLVVVPATQHCWYVNQYATRQDDDSR
jgi:hypothetical protein